MVNSKLKKGKLSNVLVVAAHPDDEVLGCGGMIAKMAQQGHGVYVLILAEGKTSRGEGNKELSKLSKEIKTAHSILGVKKTFESHFPDNQMDSIPLLKIIKEIEKVKNLVKPEIIFTHYKDDLNIDHKITFEAVITASRPIKGETVKKIYSFEILSSTEWNKKTEFLPDAYFDIKGTIADKTKAMSAYKSELKKFPHPRSIKGIQVKAMQRGMECGMEYAEAFKTVMTIG